MPLNILRLNAKKSQPNDRIVFIKPLKCKDEAIAQDFLERIAAQCRKSEEFSPAPQPRHSHKTLNTHTVPIMKEHHLSVTTLEEYEPNREFVGRNFNGGEIIQLVLKARSGHWLPFNYVQMVMMHELAHCIQMNHSRAFWKVRNHYADQMRALWGRGYTGDGMWGRGALLDTGEFETNTVAEGEELPEHLCGGTYRSRRRRKRGRKAGEELTYQERKQRRIEKKFGKDGVALGADDDIKAKLEKGKRTQAAPRVAGSNRGRELRAAAALARFDQQKQEMKEEEKPEEEESGPSEESDYDDPEDIYAGADDAVDIDGRKLLDTKGNRMVKVCEDESPDDEEAANELKELQLSITKFFGPTMSQDHGHEKQLHAPASTMLGRSQVPSRNVVDSADTNQGPSGEHRRPASTGVDVAQPSESNQAPSAAPKPPIPTSHQGPDVAERTTCTTCSFENEADTVTCSMCSNVLDPGRVPGTWKCQSTSCKDSHFLNAGDYGTCGVCGQRKADLKV